MIRLTLFAASVIALGALLYWIDSALEAVV